MGKRVTKKLEVREEIFRAAMDLFRARGFDDTSIDLIAEAVGISPRTLFRHYPNKADIVFLPAWQDLDLLRARVRLRPRGEHPFQVVENVAMEHAEYVEARRDALIEIAAMRAASSSLEQRRAVLMQVEFPELVAQEFAAREGSEEVHPNHLICARWLLCLLSLAVDEFVMDPSHLPREHAETLLGSIKEGFQAIV